MWTHLYPIEGPLHSNTYMPPIVQHPGFSGYVLLHSTTPQVNPGSIAVCRQYTGTGKVQIGKYRGHLRASKGSYCEKVKAYKEA